MSDHPDITQSNEIPTVDGETEQTYTLEVVEKLTGISCRRVLSYCEFGFVSYRTGESSTADSYSFDVEAIRRLRHIEDLRHRCQVSEQGLRILVGMLDEIEKLRADLRRLRMGVL
jgi:hypothetical protein